jgi:hypothetical protein
VTLLLGARGEERMTPILSRANWPLSQKSAFDPKRARRAYGSEIIGISQHDRVIARASDL